MNSDEVMESKAFHPLIDLNKKPVPVSFIQYNEMQNSISDTATEGEPIIKLNSIIEKNNSSFPSLDRNVLHQTLQNKGYLVGICISNDDPKNISIPPSIEPNDPSIVSSTVRTTVLEDRSPIVTNTKVKKIGNITLLPSTSADRESDSESKSESESESESIQPTEAPIEKPFIMETAQQQLKDIVDPNTTFILCNDKTNPKPPGKEPSETIPPARVIEFEPLAKIKNWRQTLCNDLEAPFQLDDRTWKNVNHFIIASRYRTQSLAPEVIEKYEELVEIDKHKKYNGKRIKIDDDYESRKHQEMYHALYAKFTTYPEYALVLQHTKDAIIYFRVNKQVKEEFVEIMWLREKLREYTLKLLQPLGYNVPTVVVRKPKNRKKESVENENENDYHDKMTSITEYEIQLPKYVPDVIQASPYFLNNRVEFVKSIKEMFEKMKKHANENNRSFDLLEHQRMVLNYIHGDRPYRGLLVYHNLGTGKSCTSIAVAEGMKTDKEIIVMLPASLKTNYWSELQKCGDAMYKQNQYWKFVSVDGKPELIPVLSKALNLSSSEIRNKKGAWMVDIREEPNFSNLSPTEQKAVQEQIQHMIHQKYKNIHYNANNLASKISELGKGKSNPFDHCVVILEEAHNFISRIVSNLKKKKKASQSTYIKIYEQMLQAEDFRIVMLSGTPIVNYPQEMGVMFNILRGGIMTWTLELSSSSNTKLSSEVISNWFQNNHCLTYDYLKFYNGKLIVTKNPFGFVNVNKNGKLIRRQGTTHRKERENRIQNQNLSKKQFGGHGEYGVELDERGNITNEQFLKQIKRILQNNQVEIKKTSSLSEKCLPDDDTFREIFIKEDTNYSDKHASTDLLKLNTLRRRILGLTSYYRTSNKEVLPEILQDKKKQNIHEIRVPMSEHQLQKYVNIRNQERQKEKKQNTLMNRQRNVNNGELFDIAGSYRVFSRCCCNFTFPNNLERPIPKNVRELEEDGNGANVDEISIEGAVRIDKEANDLDEEDMNHDQKYQQELANVMTKLRENRNEYLSEDNLNQYSPKMLAILNNIKDPKYKGLHLLYSSFRTLEGIGIFKEVLLANGFQEFKIAKENGNWVLSTDLYQDNRPCFVLYTGTEDVEMREIIRNIYNGDWNPPNVPESIGMKLREYSTNNLYGDVIKLFMITAAGSEGINLKNTRYVHIMEPYWNYVRLEQVMGRARRIHSHDSLPEKERTVHNFLYLSVLSEAHIKNGEYKDLTTNDLSKLVENKPITTDEFLYEISQMKQKINNQLLTVMKETAMDCAVHIKEHKKHEKLVCYGPLSGDSTFVDYPSLDKVLEEDHDEHLQGRE
jgi:predicted NAD-dependent protein-ADP-ribosyltransferase YbiA (DUF1768 family)